jgi:hypothetical protein
LRSIHAGSDESEEANVGPKRRRSLNRTFCRRFNREFAIPTTHQRLEVPDEAGIIFRNEDFLRHNFVAPRPSPQFVHKLGVSMPDFSDQVACGFQPHPLS